VDKPQVFGKGMSTKDEPTPVRLLYVNTVTLIWS